jgi:hypothetical protein
MRAFSDDFCDGCLSMLLPQLLIGDHIKVMFGVICAFIFSDLKGIYVFMNVVGIDALAKRAIQKPLLSGKIKYIHTYIYFQRKQAVTSIRYPSLLSLTSFLETVKSSCLYKLAITCRLFCATEREDS